MADSLVRLDYKGLTVSFNEDGWFNATNAAVHYGKRPNDWLALGSTGEYLAALMRHMRIGEKSSLIKTRTGRPSVITRNPGNYGTWFHPRLAVAFARWLDVDFAIWCDVQIDGLLKGHHSYFNWKRARSEAASSFKVMAEVLKLVREGSGKVTASHHYANEARLINGVLSGQFAAMDRERLSDSDLSLLAHLEVRNSVLIGRGLPYQDRKLILKQCAIDMRPSAPAVEAAA